METPAGRQPESGNVVRYIPVYNRVMSEYAEIKPLSEPISYEAWQAARAELEAILAPHANDIKRVKLRKALDAYSPLDSGPESALSLGSTIIERIDDLEEKRRASATYQELFGI